MTACLQGVSSDPIFWSLFAVASIAALVMILVMRFQSFQGKSYYCLTFFAMIWTLIMVGLEAASTTAACQLQWATLAWLGNALVPVAWCFFVYAYVDNASWLNSRLTKTALAVVPVAAFTFAATNQWHHLVYTDASFIPPGARRIEYEHGMGFYLIIATLYAFVLATLICLARACRRAKRSAWPLLTMLVVITLTPLTVNAAYVGLGFTVLGLDPTAFMFTLGIFAFTWLLAANKTMDMAYIGQSILFDTMSEPVILVDRNQNIVRMNSAANRSNLPGLSGDFLSELLAGVGTLDSGKTFRHLKLGPKTFEPKVREIEDPLNPSTTVLGWSVTFIDITDRLATIASLETALRRADEANREKDEFISVVSHELRTPLTSLSGGLTLALSGRLGNVPDPIHSVLNIAHRNGIRLSRLVDNILLAQKIDINALSLDDEPVDLGALLKESFEENKMFATGVGVRLDLGEITQSAVVKGDAFAIRQIIDNLVSNAIKFSGEPGIVEGSIAMMDAQLRLSVYNTGKGIPDGMESQVFGRFEQVNNSGQPSTRGSGLGLHISRKLAKQMSADIFYESQEGAGTTFHVAFQPIAQPAAERRPDLRVPEEDTSCDLPQELAFTPRRANVNAGP